MIILGIIEEVKETYDNIQLLLEELDLEGIEHFSALDLKAFNALLWIESPGGCTTYPCGFCETARSDFNTIAEHEIIYRTFGLLFRNYEAFRLRSLNAKTKYVFAIENKNVHVRRKPLAKGPPNVIILLKFPPMELHIKLGVVKNLCNHLRDVLISLEMPLRLVEWYEKSLNIKRPNYHGGEFEGNQCNKLLQNLDMLQVMIENAGIETAAVAIPHLKALRREQYFK